MIAAAMDNDILLGMSKHGALSREHVGKITPTDLDGDTALHHAARNGSLTCARILLQYEEESGITSVEAIKRKLSNATPEETFKVIDHDSSSYLSYDEWRQFLGVDVREEALASLFKRFDTDMDNKLSWDEFREGLTQIPMSMIHTRNKAGYTPLGLAAEYGRTKFVELLLAGRADPNENEFQCVSGNRPVHFACVRGFDRALRALVRGVPTRRSKMPTAKLRLI